MLLDTCNNCMLLNENVLLMPVTGPSIAFYYNFHFVKNVLQLLCICVVPFNQLLHRSMMGQMFAQQRNIYASCCSDVLTGLRVPSFVFSAVIVFVVEGICVVSAGATKRNGHTKLCLHITEMGA